MKYSQLFIKTSKDIPSDEVSLNAQLLIRAGFINKTMAGVYAFLPLGLRILNKIEDIVREEMIAIGSKEILMNSLNPKKMWTDTNRWDNVDILFKLKSQTDNEYALACTHEEQVTPLIKNFIKSWKDLPECKEKQFPLSVFQIQTKFRDELRAKSGLLRGREFRMKDMYDFHQNRESLDNYYELVKKAYIKAYYRMGLEVYSTEASGGIFTVESSHEFQAICKAGEDKIYKVSSTGEVFNQEIAPCEAKKWSNLNETELPREDIFAEDVIGVESLVNFLQIPIEKTTKTIFYETLDGKLIAACVRGDRKINEEKLQKVAKTHLKLASEDLVEKITGAKIGYAGLLNLPKEVEIYMDESCNNRKNFEMGTNKDGYHSINLNFGRDIELPKRFYDIKVVEKGDIHPETGEEYEVLISAEVGNIFKLGTKYTKAINFTYTDQNNQKQLVVMGCHGIGTSRCMAVIAEIYNDEKGLKWPENVAPFKFHLITNLDKKDSQLSDKILDLANKIYQGLIKIEIIQTDKQKIYQIRDLNKYLSEDINLDVSDYLSQEKEVFWDDRENINLGEKLADADLMGMPYQLILTPKSLQNGGIEIKDRSNNESQLLKFEIGF